MATLSRVKFGLRIGGAANDVSGTWLDFDTNIGCITDWSGLLSEGPISGDIIEQDWVHGAIWQEGPRKTYSFDVPFTSLVGDAVNPNIWESWAGGYNLLKTFRGPLLTMRRDFFDKAGGPVWRDQAAGVLVTDLAARVGIGRVISTTCVFQNLSGYWVTV